MEGKGGRGESDSSAEEAKVIFTTQLYCHDDETNGDWGYDHACRRG